MSYNIAICSGKGGTGKTTVAVNLFSTIFNKWTKNVYLVDCDVEEPNDLLFFPESSCNSVQNVVQSVPEINLENCTFCKKCEEFCEFNAISIIPKLSFATVDKDLCHSCSACLHACKFNAIHEKFYSVGRISHYKSNNGEKIIEGNLKIGSPMQTKIIKELKNKLEQFDSIKIFDAPPGTSCPVVESVINADYVIVVTEPTPFGLHDLQLTVDLMRELDKPFGLVVNKAGLGDSDVYRYIKQENIEVVAEIPFDKTYAMQYAKGKLMENVPPLIEQEYLKLAVYLKNKIVQ